MNHYEEPLPSKSKNHYYENERSFRIPPTCRGEVTEENRVRVAGENEEEQWQKPKPTHPKSIGGNDFVNLKEDILKLDWGLETKTKGIEFERSSDVKKKKTNADENELKKFDPHL